MRGLSQKGVAEPWFCLFLKRNIYNNVIFIKIGKKKGNMATNHKLIIGNCMDMSEIPNGSVHLVVTSPPYFNAPFDYKGLFKNYGQYLGVLKNVAKESFRVLAEGRIFVLNIDDMLIDGEKFPIVADAIKIFLEAGFRYRDRIVWKKPDGYLRISRRSGVILQNPYPMYFYPDNLLESIIIFQKGKFDYKSISKEVREMLCKCVMDEKNKYTLKAGVEEQCINFLPWLFSDEEFIKITNQTTEAQKFLEKYPNATILVDRSGSSLDYAVAVDYRVDKNDIAGKDINYLRLRIFINPRNNLPADKFIDCNGTYIKENLIEYIEKEQCFK